MVFDKLFGKRMDIPSQDDALPGRETYDFDVPTTHAVNGNRIQPPFPEGMEIATFALGCFWGAERLFWETDGVWSTASGYSGGHTPFPTYQEVCSGRTGHAEVVNVVYNPAKVSYGELVKIFFEAHNPTEGMRQGNDIGTQYRSIVFYHNDEQKRIADQAHESYDAALQEAGFPKMTTTVEEAKPFYYAEEYHQQYLHKVPDGYCGLNGTGVSCAIPQQSPVTIDELEPAPVSGGDDVAAADPGLKPLPATEDEWRELLGPEQYTVLRQAGTERPFTGEYNAVWEEGTYRCGACGNPLFDSTTKFDHGCGWPSFGEALPGAVEYLEDRSHGMVRTEVRCARCHSHLGHVFNDGPKEFEGARYCMNSVSLNFEQK